MNRIYDNHKNRVLIYILTIGILMFLILLTISYLNFNSKMENRFVTLSNSLSHIINSEENRIVNLYKSRLKKNLKSYGVIDAIKNKDRDTLYNLIYPRYEELKKENEFLTVMHFHTSDNKSFLRMHKPNKFGDDLSKFRNIVVDTNKHKIAQFGFEKGIYGYYYRVVLPIFDKTQHLGSVEFGIKMDYFSKNLKRLLPNTNLGLTLLKKDIIQSTKDYKNIDNYSLIIDNNNFFTSIVNEIELDKKYKLIDKEDKTYIVSSDIYIKDYKGNDAIKTLFAIDVTDYKNELINQFLLLLFIGGITYGISFIIINIGFKRYISSIQRQSKKLKEYTDIVDKYVIVSSTDLKGNITYASEAFCKVSGYTKKELIGKPHNIIRHKDISDKTFKDMWKTIQDEKTWRGEVKNRKKDGSYYWVDIVITPIYNTKAKLIGYTAIRNDITDKKVIEQMSQTDKLTQVYNRVKLDDVLMAEISRAHRYSSRFSIVLLDIDKFKEVNDTYGHQVGDEVLINTAKILSKHLRQTDILGRWGGEEFMIICPNTNKEGAKILAEKLRIDLELHEFELVGNKTASFGVTEFLTDDTESSLIKRCDDALYEAKQNGRNQVIVN